MILLRKAHPATQAMSARPITQAELLDAAARGYRNPGEPDAKQAEANAYNKPRVQWRGLTIAIENPAGSVRRGTNRHGVTWEVRMRFDYGEVVGSMGVDGDPVDIYLGPALEDAPMVYVVHQRKVGDWKAYDEDKAMAGFMTEEDAREAFLSNYTDPRFLGPITAMPVDEFVAKVRATKDKPAMIKSHVDGYVRKDGVSVRPHEDGRTKRLADDLADQEKWLRNHAQRMGHGDIDELVEQDYPEFERLAAQWRQDHPVQIMKAILFFKSYVGPYLRGGKLVNVQGYRGRDARPQSGDGQMSLFGGEPTHAEPTGKLIAEHERLVGVLESPSHADDKVEAKRQAAELAEMKQEVGSRIGDGIKDNGKIIRPDFYSNGLYPWETGYDAQVSGSSVSQDGADILEAGRLYGRNGMLLRDAIRHAEIAGDHVPPEAYERLRSLKDDKAEADRRNAAYRAAVTSAKEGPADDNPRRKFYVTIARDGRGVSRLAGPFDTHDEAKDNVHRAREAAHQLDPRSAFDSFGTAGVEADSHPPGVLNERLGIGAKPAPYTPVTNDDHPAPNPRTWLNMIPEDKQAEWLDRYRQQHELHHYELGQVREKMDRARSAKNKAETAYREAERGLEAIRTGPVPDPMREAEHQKHVDQTQAEYDKQRQMLDTLTAQHQGLYEKVSRLGREQEKIHPGSGDTDFDAAAMRRRDPEEQRQHEASMLKMYRQHYKGVDADRKRKPGALTKSIVFMGRLLAS